MKIVVISALAIVVLLSAITPNVMANKGYWTASNTPASPGMKKYHLFLDGVDPSSTDRITKLGNDGLTLCLDYSPKVDKHTSVIK
jgi:hypothetical protein